MHVDGERGWVCNDHPEHFLLASHGQDAPAGSAPDACWDEHRAAN
jgi:hypothetical protein